MKHKIGLTVHNKFDFEVRDSITNELKQTATALNIVLNGMWTRLVDGTGYFGYIKVGTGMGTLDPTRTDLFSPALSRIATSVASVVSYPTSYNKKKIVIAPEELVGSVLTEVGVASTSSGLVTHALLNDSAGNPVSITKTATDIITIYATVFSTVSAGAGLDLIGTELGTNELLRYMAGLSTSFSGLTASVGASNKPSVPALSGTLSSPLGSVALSFTTKDYANRRATSPLTRLSATACNGHICEIAYGSVARLVLPNDAICPAVSYTGIPLGTGDGVTTKYKIPSRNLKDGTLVLKKNGAIMVEGVDFTKKLVRGINHRNTSTVSAYASGSGSYAIIAKRVPNTDYFVAFNSNILAYGLYKDGAMLQVGKMATSTVEPAYEADSFTGGKFDISPIDGLIITGNRLAQRFGCYSMASGKPVEVHPTFDVLPHTSPGHIAWSPDGQHLAVVTDEAPVRIYKREGLTFTTLPVVTEVGAGRRYFHGITMYIGDYLLIGSGMYDTHFSVLKRVGDTYVDCTMVGTDPYYPPYSFVLSDDGTNLLVSGQPDKVIRYTVETGIFTRQADISLGTGKGPNRQLFRLSDGLIAATHETEPYLTIYEWDGAGTLTPLLVAPPDVAYSQSSLSMLGDDNTVVIAGTSSTYPVDISPRTTQCTFIVAPTAEDIITADYSVNGIHKTDQYVIDLQLSVQFGE